MAATMRGYAQENGEGARACYQRGIARGRDKALGVGRTVMDDSLNMLRWVQNTVAKATKGDALAQTQLGDHFAHRETTEQSPRAIELDKAAALKWYRLAVAQGNANSQVGLGVMYLEGAGVKQDYAEAERLFLLASAQRSSEAMYYLGHLYYEVGDKVRAAAWYVLFCDDCVDRDLSSIPKARADSLLVRMTKQEKIEVDAVVSKAKGEQLQ